MTDQPKTPDQLAAVEELAASGAPSVSERAFRFEFEYEESLRIGTGDPGFYALIMAAMAKADSTNAVKLRSAWPDVWAECQALYDLPPSEFRMKVRRKLAGVVR